MSILWSYIRIPTYGILLCILIFLIEWYTLAAREDREYIFLLRR